MVQQKPTPEEQLLKLIEQGGGESLSASTGKASKSAARKGGNPFAAVGKLFGIFEYWQSSFRKKSGVAPAQASIQLENVFDIKWINRALIVMVFITLAYLVFDLAFFKPGRKDFFSHVSVSEPIFPSMPGLNAPAKEAAYYLDGIKKRNPFLPPGSSSPVMDPSEETVVSTGASNIINEMLAGYKLVGISWGDEPLAMLEETATGRTYFLKKGQEFKGIKVQEVAREKVRLTYQGQESELF